VKAHKGSRDPQFIWKGAWGAPFNGGGALGQTAAKG